MNLSKICLPVIGSSIGVYCCYMSSMGDLKKTPCKANVKPTSDSFSPKKNQSDLKQAESKNKSETILGFPALCALYQKCFKDQKGNPLDAKLYVIGSSVNRRMYRQPELNTLRLALLLKTLNLPKKIFLNSFFNAKFTKDLDSAVQLEISAIKTILDKKDTGAPYKPNDLDLCLLLPKGKEITSLDINRLIKRVVLYCADQKNIALVKHDINIYNKDNGNHYITFCLKLKTNGAQELNVDFSVKNYQALWKNACCSEVKNGGYELKDHIEVQKLLDTLKDDPRSLPPLLKLFMRLKACYLMQLINDISDSKRFSELKKTQNEGPLMSLQRLKIQAILNALLESKSDLSSQIFVYRKNQDLGLEMDQVLSNWVSLIEQNNIMKLKDSFEKFTQSLLQKKTRKKEDVVKIWFACYAIVVFKQAICDASFFYDVEGFLRIYKKNNDLLVNLVEKTIQQIFPEESESKPRKNTTEIPKERKKPNVPKGPRKSNKKLVLKEDEAEQLRPDFTNARQTLDEKIEAFENELDRFSKETADQVFLLLGVFLNQKKISFLSKNKMMSENLVTAIQAAEQLRKGLDIQSEFYDVNLERFRKDIEEKIMRLFHHCITLTISALFLYLKHIDKIDLGKIFDFSYFDLLFTPIPMIKIKNKSVNPSLSKVQEFLSVIHNKAKELKDLSQFLPSFFYDDMGHKASFGKSLMMDYLNNKILTNKDNKEIQQMMLEFKQDGGGELEVFTFVEKRFERYKATIVSDLKLDLNIMMKSLFSTFCQSYEANKDISQSFFLEFICKALSDTGPGSSVKFKEMMAFLEQGNFEKHKKAFLQRRMNEIDQ